MEGWADDGANTTDEVGGLNICGSDEPLRRGQIGNPEFSSLSMAREDVGDGVVEGHVP